MEWKTFSQKKTTTDSEEVCKLLVTYIIINGWAVELRRSHHRWVTIHTCSFILLLLFVFFSIFIKT